MRFCGYETDYHYQLLLLAVTTPTYVMLVASRLHPTMTTADAVISRGLMALVVFEYFADGQQWNYHQAKQTYQSTAKVSSGCEYTYE